MAGVTGGGRRLLLLSDTRQRATRWLAARLGKVDPKAVLWVGDRAPEPLVATSAAQVLRHLGREYRLLVVDAYAGFHPDAFAAAAGTLRGAGDCVLITPPLPRWPAFADPDRARFAAYPLRGEDMRRLFIARLVKLWRTDPAVAGLSGDSSLLPRLAPADDDGWVLSEAQRAAVAAIERVARGHARRPLLLTADRGRGKSTVLGVAAARLLQQGYPRVTVVAAHRAAVETLFRHARATLGLGGDGVGHLQHEGAVLDFRLPQELLASDPATGDTAPGLLLIDEAASIPVPVLARLLDRSKRLVFASTRHGYEGSGRGFELRFSRVLQRRMPQWRALRLDQPLRWPAGDPLEALLNRSLVLDVDLADPVADGGIEYAPVAAETLVGDESLLRATFGLLVNAHYQTRPSDLRQILENPLLDIWLARRGGNVLGVMLCAHEGGFDEPMASEITNGSRRPRGHLLPQSLAVHAGMDDALRLKTLRIQRIAVHPLVQRRGIGRSLIETLAARQVGSDMLGCAFGVDEEVLAFWSGLGFQPARVGVRVDAASAAHSLFMLRGLSDAGRELARSAHLRFQQQLPWGLGGSLADLPAELAATLLAGRDCGDLRPDAWETEALRRLATGARPLATADALLWRELVRYAAAGDTAPSELAPLLAWQLQRRPLAEVVRQHDLAGRNELEVRLRALLQGREYPRI